MINIYIINNLDIYTYVYLLYRGLVYHNYSILSNEFSLSLYYLCI